MDCEATHLLVTHSMSCEIVRAVGERTGAISFYTMDLYDTRKRAFWQLLGYVVSSRYRREAAAYLARDAGVGSGAMAIYYVE